MKAKINTDNMVLVNQDTGEKISLKGVKTINAEELKPTAEYEHAKFADCAIVFGDALIQVADKTSENLKKLAEALKDVGVDETKEIVMLEERKKHCKNYLELKQINRRLNVLKFRKRKGKLHES